MRIYCRKPFERYDAAIEVISSYEVSDEIFDAIRLRSPISDIDKKSLILNACRYWIEIDNAQIPYFLQTCSSDIYSALKFKDGEYWLVEENEN